MLSGYHNILHQVSGVCYNSAFALFYVLELCHAHVVNSTQLAVRIV